MPHRSMMLLAMVSLAFAPAPPYRPRPDLNRTDGEKLQGEWRCVSCITEGNRRDIVAHPITATVKGDQMGFGSSSDTWRLEIDASGAVRRVDFHRVKPLGGTDLIRGVYRLEGDTLTICWRLRKDEAQRPTSFDPAQPGVWVSVYQRKRLTQTPAQLP